MGVWLVLRRSKLRVINLIKEAFYSAENYSHKRSDGDKSILLCDVTAGEIADIQPDSKLKRPPAINENRDFDCVSGTTKGSRVYILYGYSGKRAYPSFEIIF